ncbi:MAG: polyprenyl synthetase family protein [Thermoanaerobacterales bacterium]|nr:polyprenyl synthetase family protein [Thermoanaerobacterales bacterium]
MVHDPLHLLRADIREAYQRIATGPLADFGGDGGAWPVSEDRSVDFHLRPALVLAVTRNCHGARDRVLALAGLVQLIFMAARLHATVSEDGRGETAKAILLGDYCYSRFFSLAATSGLGRFIGPLAEVVCLMGEGGVEKCRKAPGGETAALETLRKETAGLFAESCRCAGDLIGAGPEQQQALHRFGLCLGMGYALLQNTLFRPAAVYFSEARLGVAHLPRVAARDILEGLIDYLCRRMPEPAAAAAIEG